MSILLEKHLEMLEGEMTQQADYIESKELRDPDDYEKMDQFIEDVLAAQNGKEIGDIIENTKNFKKS